MAEDSLPEEVVDEAERLTRQARDAVDPGEARAYRDARDDLLAEYDYTARVREDETRAVLVCHPDEWVADGTVRTDRIEDVDRGIEVPLSGPGDADDWETVETHNREVAETVEADHGHVHGSNAHALADFFGNHYAKPIEDATREELVEFREEYFPRNAWPSDEQRAVLDESIELTFAVLDAEAPLSE